MASKRYENNRANGVTNARVGNQSDAQTDLEGIGAEVAFCKLFNVFPDLSIEIRSVQAGEDEAFDARIGNFRIDVKATTYPTGRLLAVPWKGQGAPPDFYALMTGSFPNYTFRGLMAGAELLRPERLGNLGHGPTYIAKQHELSFELPGVQSPWMSQQ